MTVHATTAGKAHAGRATRALVWKALPVWTPATARTVVGLTRMQLIEETGLEPDQVSAVIKVLRQHDVLVELGARKKPLLWARKDVEMPGGVIGRPKRDAAPVARPARRPKPTGPAATVGPKTGALHGDAVRRNILNSVFAPLVGKRDE